MMMVQRLDHGTTVGPTAIVSDGAGEILLSGLNAGSYTNIIVELIGCSTMDVGPYVLSDPGAPTFTVAFSDPTTCGGTDGTITISGLTPATSYNITYDDDGTTVGPTAIVSDGAGEILLSGLNAGSYTNKRMLVPTFFRILEERQHQMPVQIRLIVQVKQL